jgi:uncharacterized protein YggT (Ycf19 family)
MKDDESLAADEARRTAQHESIKGEVREKVHADISREVDHSTSAERTGTAALADSLRRKAVEEVAASDTELERGKAFARVSQVVDYIFYLIYGIIGLEIVLEALGARESAGFKRFIDALAAPLLAPFQGLMPNPGVGRFRFMLSYVVALAVYILIHLAVNGLLRLFVQRKTAV